MSEENTVTDLAAEADAILADAQQSGAAAPDPGEATQAADSWASVTPALIVVIDRLVLPQWHLKDAEKAELNAALAAVLDQTFPGGLTDPRWQPYLRLVMTGGAIALIRIDPETHRLPPLFLPKAEPQANESAEAA